MVPAEELGEYADEPVRADRYGAPRRDHAAEYADERCEPTAFADEDEPESAPATTGTTPTSPGAPRGRAPSVRRAGRPSGARRRRRAALRAVATAGRAERWPIDPDLRSRRARCRPPAARSRASAADGRRGAGPRSPHCTPRSYNEARTIGERYRDGIPVIMNLTELDDARPSASSTSRPGWRSRCAASIDKVTNRVFLLTPADVEVSADDARKLAERSVRGGRVRATRSAASGGRVSTGHAARMRRASPSSSSSTTCCSSSGCCLIGRIVVELVRSFARQWVPAGPSAVALETDLHSHRPSGEVVAESDPGRPDRRRGTGPVDYGSAAGRVHTDERCPADAVVSPSHTVPPPRTA